MSGVESFNKPQLKAFNASDGALTPLGWGVLLKSLVLLDFYQARWWSGQGIFGEMYVCVCVCARACAPARTFYN
jgi:hypothetical protein